MTQSIPFTRAPQPTSPLNYVANKGESRQIPGGGFLTWDGHDWVPTIFPSEQLGGAISVDDAGVTQLASGLFVAGDQSVAGNLHTTGDLTVDGSGAFDDTQVRGHSLPRGQINTAQLATGTSGYLGQGTFNMIGIWISWTFDASRKYRVTFNGLGKANGLSAGSSVLMNIRAGLMSAGPKADKSTDVTGTSLLSQQPQYTDANGWASFCMVAPVRLVDVPGLVDGGQVFVQASVYSLGSTVGTISTSPPLWMFLDDVTGAGG